MVAALRLPAWTGFAYFNGIVVSLTMVAAVFLTLYSLLLYLRLAVTPYGLGSGTRLLADLTYWIGGGLAAVGAWQVRKGR